MKNIVIKHLSGDGEGGCSGSVIITYRNENGDLLAVENNGKTTSDYIVAKGKLISFTPLNGSIALVEEQQIVEPKKCTYCKGKGGEHVDDGHDCWGNYETKFVKCHWCNGSGVQDAKYFERRKLVEASLRVQAKLYELDKEN